MGTNCKKAKNNIAELPLKPFAAAFTINVLSKKKRPDFYRDALDLVDDNLLGC